MPSPSASSSLSPLDDTTISIATASDPPVLPPSISPKKLLNGETYTYASPVPAEVLANPAAPVILGVDEAGRGPVLGPMVYAVAYCLEDYSDTIKGLGFADSKKLTPAHRSDLLTSLTAPDSSLSRSLGWSVTLLSPSTISVGMLRPFTHAPYNLNTLAHDTTIELIQSTLMAGVNITKVYVDTVGPPDSYQTKLSRIFPSLQVTVTKKADSLFPIVSAASVCAKVTRDVAIDILAGAPSGGDHSDAVGGSSIPDNGSSTLKDGDALGSGYPGDARTINYLKKSLDPVFGWRPEVVRFSWATAKDLLDKDKRAMDVVWAEESEEGQVITGFFTGEEKGLGGWYGSAMGVIDF